MMYMSMLYMKSCNVNYLFFLVLFGVFLLIVSQVPQGWGGIGQVGMAVAPVHHYSQSSSQVPTDTESRVPVINLKDGTRLAGDDAPRRKDLEQWLKEHPGFVADTGAFIPVSLFFFFFSVLFCHPNDLTF